MLLNNILKEKHLILASGSPRRQHFLHELGLDFEIQLKEVEEIFPKELKETQITDFLAKLKASPFKNNLNKKDILITADTIVWLENKAIGKPKNAEDAKRILTNLSGKTHKVMSSICITSLKKQVITNDTTLVKFKTLSQEEIIYYIDKYQPFDKAGSYGIQEWIGYIGIEKIEGSFFNVMGLPTHKLHQELLTF